MPLFYVRFCVPDATAFEAPCEIAFAKPAVEVDDVVPDPSVVGINVAVVDA